MSMRTVAMPRLHKFFPYRKLHNRKRWELNRNDHLPPTRIIIIVWHSHTLFEMGVATLDYPSLRFTSNDICVFPPTVYISGGNRQCCKFQIFL